MSTRRSFLATLSALAVGPAASRAVEPFVRAQPNFLPALAGYSFRQFFATMKGKPQTLPEGSKVMSLFDFLDFCAKHGVAAEPTSYFFPPEADEAWYLEFRRQAFLKGVPISGTAVGNNFARAKGAELDAEIADVKLWIDRSSWMGAPHIRVFAGSATGVDPSNAKTNCISALEECAAYAGAKGIFLGLENHGGIVAEADGLLEIIKAVKSPWVGINLDTGNFHSANPYADLARCAPYAVNVQIKTEIKAKDKAPEKSDLKTITDLLVAANYQGYVALEYEAASDPFTAVPEWLKEIKAALASAG